MNKHGLLAAVMCLAALAMPAMANATPAAGQYQRGGAWVDSMIEEAFQDVLRRRPDESELRRYRVRVHEDHWSLDDIKSDIRGRRDYMNHSDRTGRDGSSYNVDRVIRNAYQDILGRGPSSDDLRRYRNRMLDDGWTERQVRDELRQSQNRQSQNYGANSSASADRIIRRAYQDLLGRAPDAQGLATARNQIMYHGWDEHDVRQAIMSSPEYRQKGNTTEAQAREIVRRAYLSVLGREPDPASAPWVQRVLRDHWTERDIARELRNSEEYRNKQH